MSTPIVWLRPRANERASALCRKPSRSAVTRTCSRVAAEIRSVPFNAFEAVDSDTPAAAATSDKVISSSAMPSS